MSKEYFSNIKQVSFEGASSNNPLAFRYYDPSEIVEGKTMKEHMRFSCVYWHTMRGNGSDPFGAGTMLRPWDDGSLTVENACRRADVFFELVSKLQIPFFAFHDRDISRHA